MSIDFQAEQIKRLEEAGIKMQNDKQIAYLKAVDELPASEGSIVPEGYKQCGRCKKIKKFYLFNRNSSAKNNCTGNCKECQKETAKKSYANTKHKRDYKRYYAEHRDEKREQGRQYYQDNKDEILERQKEYRGTKKGRKVMNKAHAKRRAALETNKGIPYTREQVIDRDKEGNTHPICILCDKPIEDVNDIHMEHLIPIVIGGLDCFTNVGCAHDVCNLSKSKDAREITTEQVEKLRLRAEAYIDAHVEDF